MALVTQAVSQCSSLSISVSCGTIHLILSPGLWQASTCPPSQAIPQPPPEPAFEGLLKATLSPCPMASPETLLLRVCLGFWWQSPQWPHWPEMQNGTYGDHKGGPTLLLTQWTFHAYIYCNSFTNVYWAPAMYLALSQNYYSCEQYRHSPPPKGLTVHWRVWTLKVLDPVPNSLSTHNLVLKGSP